jgi:hypothetical protein
MKEKVGKTKRNIEEKSTAEQKEREYYASVKEKGSVKLRIGNGKCNNRIFQRSIIRFHCCVAKLYTTAQLRLLSLVLYIAPPR